QAEDGIRDLIVTGVQTCALPILRRDARPASGEILSAVEGSRAVLEMPEVQLQGVRRRAARLRHLDGLQRVESLPHTVSHGPGLRSEERRVGKECRSRWSSSQ